jgi:hypothetical protein
MKNRDVIWPNDSNETTCDLNYEKFLYKNYIYNNYLLLFNAPIYTIDRKGSLRKVENQNELRFQINPKIQLSYIMDTKYIVIEDDSNIYYTSKKYDAYFTMNRPIFLEEEGIEEDYSLEIEMQNKNNDQIVLITIYKYKLLDFLAKLGGIMKIITFMKMTGKFWSSYFYETTLYNLLVKRKNIYLEQKKQLLDTSVYHNKNKLKKLEPTNSGDSLSYNKSNLFNSTSINYGAKNKRIKDSITYTSYCSWFLNRFCKLFYDNKEAKQKRTMLVDILGLNNYLLHLDYIDRQIILEQQTGEIDNKIKEIIEKNKGYNNIDSDSTSLELQKDIKSADFSLIGNNRDKSNLKKPLALNEKI